MFAFLDPNHPSREIRADRNRAEWREKRQPALIEAIGTQDVEAFQDEIRWLNNAAIHVFPGDKKQAGQAMHDFLVGLEVHGVKVKAIDVAHPLDRLKEMHVPQIVYCPMTEMQYEGYLKSDARTLQQWADGDEFD